jgi:hypothetical protein
MSYLFCVILYEKARFDPALIEDHVRGMNPTFAGECLVKIPVTKKVEAIFYLAGAFPTKSLAFMYACEDYLVDGFPDTIAEAFRNSNPPAAGRFYVWLSSDMFPYDVALKYTPDSFEGRAVIEDKAERVALAKGQLLAYELAEHSIQASDFGLRGNDESSFDEDAYHEAIAQWSEPFDPEHWIKTELQVSRLQIINALEDLATKGQVFWPEGGPRFTPALKKKTARCDDPILPDLPLWDYLREQHPKTPQPAAKPAKKASAKPAAKPVSNKPAAKPANKPAAKPANKPAAKPANKPAAKPAR